jgi:hypothetical protein
MTSLRKIAANRHNSRKSSGPRSVAGKATASRNALRHGFAARAPVDPELSPEIERLARTICHGDNDPSLFEQARVVAANQLMLRAICAQRIAVIERLRDTKPIALAKGDNGFAVAKIIARRLDNPDLGRSKMYFERGLNKEKISGTREMDSWTVNLVAAEKLIKERDEFQAVKEAAPDLVRLERYYRRISTQQTRAIQKFTSIKLTLRLAQSQADCQLAT